jgi:hypothetical protein
MNQPATGKNVKFNALCHEIFQNSNSGFKFKNSALKIPAAAEIG